MPRPVAIQPAMRDAIHNHACAMHVLSHPEKFPKANTSELQRIVQGYEREILAGDAQTAVLYLSGRARYDRATCHLTVPDEPIALAS
jgi:hypothetical protein